MRPYLCGPINGCTDDEANNWREVLLNHFPDAINPMRRDYRGIEESAFREIVVLDKKDIMDCDVLVVNFVKPSVGTAMEIFYAHSLGKPIILWVDRPTSFPLNLSPWLHYHVTCIVHRLDDVVNKVKMYTGPGT